MRAAGKRPPFIAGFAALSATAWLCSGAALAPGAFGQPTPGPTMPGTEPESVTVADCHASPLQVQRYATFAAEMTATRKTQQMWVRFTLLERLPTDAALHRAVAPGLNVWQKSTPGIDLFRYSQEVANLPAPGDFRALVNFRWYNAHHAVIRRSQRLTPICRMPDERPHLRVGAITPTPGSQPQTTQYAVTIRNDGLGPAQKVGVLLTINGAAQPQQTIAELAPASSQTLTFDGPQCGPAGSLSVTLDPAGSVDQTTRMDDTKTVGCS
jgi:CARDB